VARAGQPRVHGGRPRDHPLEREALAKAREAGLAHSLPLFAVLQQPDDRVRHRVMIARRREKARHAVVDHLWNPAGGGGHDGLRTGHGVE